MSVSSHLDQLRQKHEALEARIKEQQKHPGADNLEITSLKREKLVIKEKIERITATADAR
ncbi:MAG TPA: DUF465 domain-containing protein [Paracoccaceae bacterium]|nr:DUF465 domain-containing protein [Paracoccaceae bacterium]